MDVYVTYKKITKCSGTIDTDCIAEKVAAIRKRMDGPGFYTPFPTLTKGESEEDYRERIAEWFSDNSVIMDSIGDQFFDEDAPEFEDFEVSEA